MSFDPLFDQKLQEYYRNYYALQYQTLLNQWNVAMKHGSFPDLSLLSEDHPQTSESIQDPDPSFSVSTSCKESLSDDLNADAKEKDLSGAQKSEAEVPPRDTEKKSEDRHDEQTHDSVDVSGKPSPDATLVTKPDEKEEYVKQLHQHYNSHFSSFYKNWFQSQMATLIEKHSAAASQPAEQKSEPFEYHDYSVVGRFNVFNHRFQGSTNDEHWLAKGLPTDRDGRQLAHYVDLRSLEEGRGIGKKHNWKKMKEAIKAQKKKKQKVESEQ